MKQKKKESITQTLEECVDITSDVVSLLSQVGIVDIETEQLESVIHEKIKAQDLLNFAAGLFFNRGRKGVITFNQLLSSFQQVKT